MPMYVILSQSTTPKYSQYSPNFCIMSFIAALSIFSFLKQLVSFSMIKSIYDLLSNINSPYCKKILFLPSIQSCSIMFEQIGQVSSLDNLRSSSASYSYECISERCNIGRDVWIKYYKNENEGNGTFTISDSICMMGDVPTIMLYLENDDKSNGKTYGVYRYNGKLLIDRRIVGNIKHDILSNIDTIISDLRLFLDEVK